MKKLIKTYQALLLGAVFIAPSALYASTAANTTITNTVTVFYKDATAATDYNAAASVAFNVSLLAAAPTIAVTPTTQETTETTAIGTAIAYTVTANANGADDYSFDLASIINGTDLSAATAITWALSSAGGAFDTANGVLRLGGTTLAEALTTGATTIVVPWDGEVAGTNTAVNDLVAGDTIMLDGAEYVIDSISNAGADALINNRSTITLATAYTGANLPVGTIIGERATITLNFTTGNLQGGAVTADYTIAPEVTYADSGSLIAGTATVTVTRPSLTINKYVRNVTSPSGTGATFSVSGDTYYTDGVSGKPGDVMEYLIHIDNTVETGASKATNIVVADVLPEFTSIDSNTVSLIAATDKAVVNIISSDWETAMGSAAEVISNYLCIYAGDGGVTTPGSSNTTGTPCAGTGGELGPDAAATPAVPAQRSLLKFQVTIE